MATHFGAGQSMNLSDDWRARSPFMTETHDTWAWAVRRFLEKEAMPKLEQWEAQREVPREFHRSAGDAGILGLGWPEQYGGSSEGIDVFHLLVQMEELARTGSGGLLGGLTIQAVTLPPLLEGGSEQMKQRVVPAVISGERISAVAVTEPSGGSDVARLKTRAEKRGDRYIVNGSKIFISNGIRADYYVTAVRTGSEQDGLNGLSLLLIEKGMKGFTQTKLEKMGYHCQDTAALYFDNVEVPAENLIGPENGGFRLMTKSFNTERLTMSQQCCGFARACLEEAMAWAQQRETFGKRLGQHQVIRVKLANMVRQLQATQAMVDVCAWQHKEGKSRPADLAMLKVQSSLMLEAIARDAAQVLGGASVLLGSVTERVYREVRINAIGGGSEEILLDMAGRHLGFN